VTLLVAAVVILVASGLAALALSRWPAVSSAVGALGVVAGAVAGEVQAVGALAGGGSASPSGGLSLGWSVPYGAIRIAVDPLSAFFLVPVFGLSGLAAPYGMRYLLAFRAKKALGPAWFAFNLLVAAMAVVVVARQAVLFLVAWEVMSLAAFVLVAFEHEQPDVRRAGWVFLLAAHVGTAFLVALFLVLGVRAGSFDFEAMRAATPPGAGLAALLFALAFLGFGVKAGFVPLHVWLPEAHAAAPSHVSAVMSGVLIKMGIYGILRVLPLLGRPAPWWGPFLMAVGLVGALVGISLALVQRDLKRVLAYSSVENVGIITLGLGTGLWGWTSGQPAVAMLGLVGGLVHVINHTLIKGLLFLGAGSVVHGCGTRDMERLGGVMKRMPLTGPLLLLGAVALSALPPMNVFVSEWLVYLGLIQGAMTGTGAQVVVALLAVGAVSLVGGLAVLCFVRLVGIVLLGEPRSDHARHAHESPASMTAPMALLGLAGIAVGVVPLALVTPAARVAAELLGTEIPWTAPVSTIGVLDAALLIVIGACALAWRILQRRRTIGSESTWGCGYAGAAPRAQYTASSFAELVAGRLLPVGFRPRASVRPPAAIFPGASSLSSEYADPVTRGVYEPFLARWGDRFARLRWVQQGMLHVYIAYVLVAALGALAWTSMRAWIER
jgi:formate hydrogenlyase subunit 3/multisubunit Na+/H+ antiporter MnhD subunit